MAYLRSDMVVVIQSTNISLDQKIDNCAKYLNEKPEDHEVRFCYGDYLCQKAFSEEKKRHIDKFVAQLKEGLKELEKIKKPSDVEEVARRYCNQLYLILADNTPNEEERGKYYQELKGGEDHLALAWFVYSAIPPIKEDNSDNFKRRNRHDQDRIKKVQEVLENKVVSTAREYLKKAGINEYFLVPLAQKVLRDCESQNKKLTLDDLIQEPEYYQVNIMVASYLLQKQEDAEAILALEKVQEQIQSNIATMNEWIKDCSNYWEKRAIAQKEKHEQFIQVINSVFNVGSHGGPTGEIEQISQELAEIENLPAPPSPVMFQPKKKGNNSKIYQQHKDDLKTVQDALAGLYKKMARTSDSCAKKYYPQLLTLNKHDPEANFYLARNAVMDGDWKKIDWEVVAEHYHNIMPDTLPLEEKRKIFRRMWDYGDMPALLLAQFKTHQLVREFYRELRPECYHLEEAADKTVERASSNQNGSKILFDLILHLNQARMQGLDLSGIDLLGRWNRKKVFGFDPVVTRKQTESRLWKILMLECCRDFSQK